ncbi:transketolase family protein [Streptomyces sp. NPDC091406]|uniref:transketolase family protein n=1 Tax=unclassified Streptomyces TaxID=2593676 RepID=UPI00382D525A
MSDLNTADRPALSSREVYREALLERMRSDTRLVCLDSDTGLFNGSDRTGIEERYFNLGIAEHTLMGTAAGLARQGRIPVVNTMAAFAATRALEAVKVDIALNRLPVRIAATHSGVSAGHLGPTHHSLEDLAVMRALPDMTVVVPTDAATTELLFLQSLDLPGPVYLRLGRNATPDLPADAPPVELGRIQVLRHGQDVTLVACGPYPVLAALEAAGQLAADGIAATVLNVHTVKPLDEETLLAAAGRTGTVITVEEHWPAGGLGGAVAEALGGHREIAVHRIGLPDAFASVAGGQQYQLERAGVTSSAVAARAKEVLTT